MTTLHFIMHAGAGNLGDAFSLGVGMLLRSSGKHTPVGEIHEGDNLGVPGTYGCQIIGGFYHPLQIIEIEVRKKQLVVGEGWIDGYPIISFPGILVGD